MAGYHMDIQQGSTDRIGQTVHQGRSRNKTDMKNWSATCRITGVLNYTTPTGLCSVNSNSDQTCNMQQGRKGNLLDHTE